MLHQQAGNALHSVSHCCSLFVFFVVTIIKKTFIYLSVVPLGPFAQEVPTGHIPSALWYDVSPTSETCQKQSKAWPCRKRKVVTSWQLWRSERMLQWKMACSEKWKQSKGHWQRPQTGSTRGWLREWPKIEMSNGSSLWQMLIGMQTFPRWQQAHVYVESRDAASRFFKRNTVFAKWPGEGVSRFLVYGGYSWLPRRAYQHMACQWSSFSRNQQ